MIKEHFGLTIAILGSFFLVCFVPFSLAGEIVDHSLYGELLKKYVKDSMVNYQGFKNEEQRLDEYLQILNKTNPEELPRKEQFAFYINAYNACTIKLILKHYPGVKSIKDIGSLWRSPWKIRFCKINGKTFTLDEIEHNILRLRFKDPRVHFAVNCASKDCPPLIAEPYQGTILDQQLDANTRAFLNNPRKNRLEGDTLYVSSIFKWFEDDFKADVVGFFLTYADEDLKKRLLVKREQIKIKHLDYDWSLNGE